MEPTLQHDDPFHRRLRRLRKERRMTMKEVAEKIGVPITTYREWEYGRGITGEPYMRIADALAVSLIELMTGKKPEGGEILDALQAIEMQLTRLKRHVETGSRMPLRTA